MDLFRRHPSLCSLYLSALEEWGAVNMDWSLLSDEEFVDHFLQKICACQSLERETLTQACSVLLQPSPGGLMAAAVLKHHGVLSSKEFSDFVEFTLRGSGQGWKELSWPLLIELLEDIAFSPEHQDPAWNLANLMSRGWIKRENQTKFFRRIWQTDRIDIDHKRTFFRWLYGQHQWPDLPKAPSSFPGDGFSLKVAYRLSSAKRPFSARRQALDQGRFGPRQAYEAG